MEDDKRFIRSDNDDKKEEEKKRIPIQLPEIEYPSRKEAAPEEDIKAKLQKQDEEIKKLEEEFKEREAVVKRPLK